MPANLPPEYFEAEKHFKQALSSAEKITALEALIATVPKHKGTDKLRADLRRRLSKLKEEALIRAKKRGHPDIYTIKREGAAQVALVGFPNAGKSTLLACLTNARPLVADYPISTLIPILGMMPFEDIQIQLIDLPPVGNEATDGWVSAVLRAADLFMLVIDLKDDPAGYYELLINQLESWNINPLRPNEPEERLRVSKWVIIAGSKLDIAGAQKGFEELKERCGELYPIIPISAEKKTNLEDLKRSIFEASHIIRVYSKPPGKEPDLSRPFTLKMGATVLDLAGHIHKEFLERLKFARVWGSARFKGQKVQRDYILRDKDIVEIHT